MDFISRLRCSRKTVFNNKILKKFSPPLSYGAVICWTYGWKGHKYVRKVCTVKNRDILRALL